MAELKAQRDRELAEEAKRSDLCAAIRKHWVALDDIDQRLGSLRVGTTCPICRPADQPRAAPIAFGSFPAGTPPSSEGPSPARDGAAQQPSSAGTSAGSAEAAAPTRSFAAAAAKSAAPPPQASQRLLARAMRPVVKQQTHMQTQGHKMQEHSYGQFREFYRIRVCAFLFWLEVLHFSAEKAIQRLKSADDAKDHVSILACLHV